MTVERIDGQKDTYQPSPDYSDVVNGALHLYNENDDGDQEIVAIYAKGQWVRCYEPDGEA